MNRRLVVFLALMALNAISNSSLKNKKLKNNKNKLSLPSFKNIIEVKSSIQGRIRFYIPAIKGNESLAFGLKEQVSKIPVIKLCRINLVTGSLLLEYDENQIDPQTLEGAIIKLLGISKELEEGRVSELRKKVVEMKQALDNGIYDFTRGFLDLKTLVAVALISIAVMDFRRVGRNQSPGYPTLLWWGSSLFV